MPSPGDTVSADVTGLGARCASRIQRAALDITLCPSPRELDAIYPPFGDGGNYIKPLLVQAAWAAIGYPAGGLPARFHRLVRRFGGARNKGAVKRAIMAIARTLLKIAYQVLKTGTPYTDLGADFYASRETPQARQDYLIRQLQKLNPGCVITVTPAEAA